VSQTGSRFTKTGGIFVGDRRHGIMVINPDDKRIQPNCWTLRSGAVQGANDLAFSRMALFILPIRAGLIW